MVAPLQELLSHTKISCKRGHIIKDEPWCSFCGIRHISGASCAPAAGLRQVRLSSSLRLALEESVWVCCGSSPLQWLLRAGHLMCSELGYTHTHTHAIGIFRTVPGVRWQGLHGLLLRIQCGYSHRYAALLHVSGCKWEKKKSENLPVISTLLDNSTLLSPFIRLVFVLWQAFYYLLLIVYCFVGHVICGRCVEVRLLTGSWCPPRATWVIRVEHKGP